MTFKSYKIPKKVFIFTIVQWQTDTNFPTNAINGKWKKAHKLCTKNKTLLAVINELSSQEVNKKLHVKFNFVTFTAETNCKAAKRCVCVISLSFFSYINNMFLARKLPLIVITSAHK